MSKRIVNASILAEVNKAAGRGVENPVVSFDAAVSTFLDFAGMRGLSEHTVSSYAKEIKQLRSYFLESEIDLDDVAKLNAGHYESFVRSQLERGFAHSTINTRLRTAKIFGNFCVRKGYFDHNHASDVQTLRVRKQIGDTFTKSQLKRLLAEPDISTFEGVRDLTIMMLFADTGIRLSELTAVCTNDVIFADKSVNVQRTKNGYARRIPLTKRLQAILKAYLRVRGITDDTDALFITGEDKPLDPRSIQFQIRKHGKEADLLSEVQCSPHVFRRTFAKFKVQAGVDIFTLQALMGHSDISELKNYVAIYSTDLDAAIEKGVE